MRNIYVGLKGDFGTFLIGRHDTPLKTSTIPLELFADSIADNNAITGFSDIRADNIIAYISPSIGGFQFAAATLPSAGSTKDGDENRKANGIADSYSLAVTYGNGPWYASVTYEVIDETLYPTNYDDTTVVDLTNVWLLGGVSRISRNGVSVFVSRTYMASTWVSSMRSRKP